MSDVIAIVFDFDDTLAPDSTSGFLAGLGVDVERFWRNDVQALIDDGWDPVPAYLYRMLQLSEASPDRRITRERLAAFGRKAPLYRGVRRIFRRLREHVRSIAPLVQVEFYIVSSGIGEIVRNTPIAREFTDVWACDFHYRPDGRIEFPKNIVSFTDKTRYLFQISKGLVGPEYRNRPFEVNRYVPPEQLRVPFRRMVFVGDGYTDIPCFSLVRKQGGIAIGVYDVRRTERWGRAWGFVEDDRVSNLVPADYSMNSALTTSLMMAVARIASQAAP